MELPAHAREPAPMTASPGKDASLWGCPVAGNAARPVACEMQKLRRKSSALSEEKENSVRAGGASAFRMTDRERNLRVHFPFLF